MSVSKYFIAAILLLVIVAAITWVGINTGYDETNKVTGKLPGYCKTQPQRVSCSPIPKTSSTTIVPTLVPTITTPVPPPVTSSSSVPTQNVLWGDEFNGTTVDSTKWNIRDNSYASNEASCQFSRQVTQNNGILSIRVDKGNFTCGARTSAYASGYVDSVNKTPPLGVNTRWEWRAKMPITPNQSQGYWPALWLRSNEADSNYSAGELDTLEVWGSVKPDVANSDFTSVHTIHEDTNGTASRSGYVFRWPSGHSGDGFHRYAMDLLSDRIVFYVDGVAIRTVTTTTAPWLAKLLASGVTWNVRMNVQICNSTSWCSAPNSSTLFGQTMDIDYLRVTSL